MTPDLHISTLTIGHIKRPYVWSDGMFDLGGVEVGSGRWWSVLAGGGRWWLKSCHRLAQGTDLDGILHILCRFNKLVPWYLPSRRMSLVIALAGAAPLESRERSGRLAKEHISGPHW